MQLHCCDHLSSMMSAISGESVVNIGSILHLGMAKEFQIYHTYVLAGKKLQTPKTSMQVDRYHLAVHKNVHKCTLE